MAGRIGWLPPARITPVVCLMMEGSANSECRLLMHQGEFHFRANVTTFQTISSRLTAFEGGR
jgi:hypothetical protein